jgi:hypothetical protein
MGVRREEKLVEHLQDQLWEESLNVIEESERQVIDDTPEAYAQREIGLEKERRKQSASLRSNRSITPRQVISLHQRIQLSSQSREHSLYPVKYHSTFPCRFNTKSFSDLNRFDLRGLCLLNVAYTH